MATFQDNFRALSNILATGPDGSYRLAGTQSGNWNSGAPRTVSEVPNVYTDQNKVMVEDKAYTPKDPTTDPNFIENYRNTTKTLGAAARAMKTRGQKYPNVDAETKAIMNRIKLPSYADAMTEGKRMELADLASKDATSAIKKYKKESDEWEEDNFYYKLRAAQALKDMPKKSQDSFLNNFDISMYDAKNELDKIVDDKNKSDAKNIALAQKSLGLLGNKIGESLNNLLLSATGQRETYTDKNGVKHTVTVSSGPANLDELANSLGENDSFRLYNKDEYGKNGELTNEAKSRGPSAWNSKEASSNNETSSNSGEAQSSETSGEIIEYTYKPGDTFGQVLLNLGLSDGTNLWGENGDVAYYTQQLVDQGIWPDGRPHNIPIGTTIKLKRRR